MSEPTPHRANWPAPLAAAALLAALLTGLAHLGHEMVLRHLNRSLSRQAGVPVTLSGLRGTLGPSIVVEGIRIGSERSPILTVEQAEVDLNLNLNLDVALSRRPTVREVRLIRPVLRLSTDQGPWRRSRRGSTSTGPSARSGAGWRWPAVRLIIEDGQLHIHPPPVRPGISLSARGVYLHPTDRGLRLILGQTSLSREGQWLLETAAAAAELGSSPKLHLTRLAALGGRLHLPGAPGASLSLHRLTVEEHLGGFRVEAVGKTAGRHTGRFDIECLLDPTLQPDLLTARLHNVDLTALDPLLEPLGIQATGTRLGGTVSLQHHRGEYRLETRLAGKQLRVHHPVVATRSVGPFDGQLAGAISVMPQKSALKIHQLKLVAGATVLELAGELESSAKRTRVALDVRMPETPCQEVLASLPANFAPALEGMALKGNVGLAGRLRLDSAALDDTKLDIRLEPFGCRVLADPPRADVRSLEGEVTIRVSGPRGTGMDWPLGPSNPDWRPLGKISRHARAAFVVAEDGNFYSHDGFDLRQLKRAFVINLKEGRVLRGASTISQQLIKNVFLNHRRNFSRKFQEAVLTWRVEQVVSKRRILELYLNLVEMGPGVYGVAQAARHYFGRSARSLTPLQAAHLAALTPSPRHLGQRFMRGEPGLAWTQKLRMLLRMMRRQGSISREEQRRWESESLSLLKRD